MKKGWVCFLGALLFLPIQSAVADMSWYLGAGGGWTKLKTNNFASVAGLNPVAPATGSVSSSEFSDSPFGWQVFGGLMFTENFGLVAKYSDSGKAKNQWPAVTDIDPDGPDVPLGSGPLPSVQTSYDFTGEMQLDGFTIYATQIVPIGDKFAYGIEVGWTTQDIEFQWDSTSTPPTPNTGVFKGEDSNFAFGALLRYKFLEHVAVSTEFEWLLVEFGGLIEKPIRLNVNLEVHF